MKNASNINARTANNNTTTAARKGGSPKAIVSLALRALNGVQNAARKAGLETRRANLRPSDSRWTAVVGTNRSYMRQVPELVISGADGDYIINLAIRVRSTEAGSYRCEASVYIGFGADPTKYQVQRLLLDQGDGLPISTWVQPSLTAEEIRLLSVVGEEYVWGPMLEAIGDPKWERSPQGQLVYHI
jgi:hypothetical protein